jgi:hypothetical protein
VSQLSDGAPGALILVVLVPCIYFAARAAVVIGAGWSAYRLAPLAPLIEGTIDRKSPCIRGTYCGTNVRVSFTPKQAIGSGESATSINAFYIQVTDLPGKHNWRIPFGITGLLGQAQKSLYIETLDEEFRERMDRAGVLLAVGAVSAPTANYVTVDYDCRLRTLTYTDDVSPKWIPSQAAYAKHLTLVAHLVQLNKQLNPA